jgi:putative phosphoesterase
MLLGVVSDTHGHVPYTQAAIRMLESLQVEAVVHCGDIGSVEIPPLFTPWPTHFVFGNVDHDADGLEAAIQAQKLTCHRRFADITLAGRRIAVIHSDDFQRFRDTITSGEYDLVCYGHSHLAEQHREGRTLVLNPGALYRANPHSLAIVDLKTMEAMIVNLL